MFKDVKVFNTCAKEQFLKKLSAFVAKKDLQLLALY